MLAYQHTISHCIIHFVALEVITEISMIYFESQVGCNKLVEVMHHVHLKNDKVGREISFSERALFHKIGRLVYKVFRSIYISFFFYFFPFTILFMQWSQKICSECGEGEE